MSISLSTKLATMIACTIPGVTLYRSPKGQDNWSTHNTIPDCFNWARYDYKVDQFDSGVNGGPDPQRTPSRLVKAISVMKEAWENPGRATVEAATRGSDFDSYYTSVLSPDDVEWDWFHNDYRTVVAPQEQVPDPVVEQAPAPEVVAVGVTWAAPEADVVLGTPEIESMIAVMRAGCQPGVVITRSIRGAADFEPCDENPNRYNWYKYDYAVLNPIAANIDAALGDIIDASESDDLTKLRAATKHLLALIGE